MSLCLEDLGGDVIARAWRILLKQCGDFLGSMLGRKWGVHSALLALISLPEKAMVKNSNSVL